MNFTRTERKLRDQHRKLWLWLAQNPGKYKNKWPGWDTEEVRKLIARFPQIESDKCFACYGRDRGVCGKICPIKEWIPGKMNVESVTCMEPSALYYEWYNTVESRPTIDDYDRLSTLALHIAFAWK